MECPDAYRESLVIHTMNAREKEQIIHAASPALEFTRLWTMKEAVLKCSGTGLIDDLKPVLEEKSLDLVTETDPKGRYVYSVCYGSV